VYHEIFKSDSTRDILLKSYVTKGILPDVDYMASEEFESLLIEARAMFS